MSGTIFSWESSDPEKATKVIGLRRYYEFLSKRLYDEYEPTKIAKIPIQRNFLKRVDEWLGNFSSDELRYSAFRSIEYIFFAGKKEYEELYRCADSINMRTWLRSKLGLKIFDNGYQRAIKSAIRETWICPATDSLKINEFLKITGLRGHSNGRADWRSMKRMGQLDGVKKFIREEKVERIVLLEDFVGSGRQYCDALETVASIFDGPVLALPLVICEEGCKSVRGLIKRLGRNNIELSPVLVVPPNCMIGPIQNVGEPRLFQALRNSMVDGYKTMKLTLNGEAYGFEWVGSLTVLYSNCPNNVPPIYHSYGKSEKTWKPIFPRGRRA